MSTANSSPPSRASRSLSRTSRPSRTAISCSSRSPWWWPSVSLTSLNRSRSMGDKSKGGREAKKPKAQKNVRVGGQTPVPTSADVINHKVPPKA